MTTTPSACRVWSAVALAWQLRHRIAALILVAHGLSGPLAAAFSAEESTSQRKPNIVFILADDLGWTDLGCQGSKYYETPHIDRLAAQGLRFTNGYTCGPNCQPTRAALMSGQYGPRTGIYTVGGTDRFDTSMRPLTPVENVVRLAPEKITVAESLNEAGYATGMFGKWHLGEDAAHHPLAQGFDEAIVSMGRHFDFATNPRVQVPKGAYLADFLTDKAVDFMERHENGPFFLYLPHFGVHSPHQAKQEWIAHFKAKPAAGGHDSPVYAAMIASVDESVGRVLAKLDELKLADNTLVIFSSDNGGVGGYREAGVEAGEGITDNAPLRGGKGMLYEGGVRVPFIFRWPGKIATGAVSKEPIISVDLYQTFLALAGGTPPKGQPLDGLDLSPLLTGKAKELHRGAMYWHFPGYLGSGKNIWRTTPAGAIRIGDFKLLEFFETGQLELYNLREDLSQRHDLAKDRPDLVREMREKLKSWRQSVGAPMPAKRQVASNSAPAEEVAAPAGLSSREAGRRKSLLESGGGSEETERAVAAALHWLARHQNPDGGWGLSSYPHQCKDQSCALGLSLRGNQNASDVAATALAVLPFLGSGKTHQSKGNYQKTIYGGIHWLMKNQKSDGDLRGQHAMYAHGLATLALCEACGMSHDTEVRAAAQKAIDFTCQAQDPAGGGWRYAPKTPGDTSVTGWQVMSLKSGKLAGLALPDQVLNDAQKFLKSVSTGQGGFFGYTDAGKGQTTSAVGLLCSQQLGMTRDDPGLQEGIAFLMSPFNLPMQQKKRSYYYYYAAQVLHNVPGKIDIRGIPTSAWEDWNSKLSRLLIDAQETNDCAAGSWSPTGDPHGEAGGRIMTTSLSCLTLEVYYRYPPVYGSDGK